MMLVFVILLAVGIVSSDCQTFKCSGPIDCQDIYSLRNTQTGVYTIFPQGTFGFRVRCDMNTTVGGWTVIQRRVSNDTDFYRTWNEYQTGFGDLDGNFWIGNQQIHMVTSQGWYELRIDMKHMNGSERYAQYNVFKVGDAESQYKLTIDGYHGDAGDDLIRIHNGMKFGTKDRDNDIHSGNCADSYHGGWWYEKCHVSNLNGMYGNTEYAQGLTWYSFTGYYSSLSSVEMKIRRWG